MMSIVALTRTVLRPATCRLLLRNVSLSATSFGSPDYYAVLGLTRAATLPEVKYAYFKNAKRYHPDTNDGDEAKWMFELVAEAYDVLSDDEKRKLFDETGETGRTFGGTAGGPGRPKDHMSYDSEELFNKIFGESMSERAKPTNDDGSEDFASSNKSFDSTKEFLVNLTFEEAAVGVKQHYIDLNVRALCIKCSGTRSEMGYTWQVCVYCEGTGIETEKVGHVLTRKTCSYCDGSKQFIKYKCIECEGTGQTVLVAPYEVDIPPGMEDGQVLKIRIREDILKYTIAHDPFFYIYVRVKRDDYYVARDDLDVYSQADVSVAQAILGGQLVVRGLHDKRTAVDVPEGTGSHQALCCTGQGIHRSDGVRKGNHFVRTGLRLGSGILSDRQIELWGKFAATEEPPKDGTVKGVASEDDHRYEVSAIEASEVRRSFLVATKEVDKSDIAMYPQDQWSYTNKLRNFFNKGE